MTTKQDKQHRMELRRQTGSRVVHESKPAPKRPEYLIAHVCFTCRKSFKKTPVQNQEVVCPECGGTLYEMGRSFKAPRKNDVEQWHKVQALYAYGFRFFSYRSYPEAPKLPERFKEVEAFVAENPMHPFRVAAPNKALQPIRRRVSAPLG